MGAEHDGRRWRRFPGRLSSHASCPVCNVRGAEPLSASHRQDDKAFWEHSGKGWGGPEVTAWRGGTGSSPKHVWWCHLVSPFQTLVKWSQKPPAFFFFFPPDQRHSRKMAFPRFYKSVQQLFLFPFSVFLALCMWWRRLGCMSDNVDVLQWACEWMCVFKGLWELVRFRSGWGAVLKNGWRCVSLYWQTRESCLPPVSLGQISPIYFKYI